MSFANNTRFSLERTTKRYESVDEFLRIPLNGEEDLKQIWGVCGKIFAQYEIFVVSTNLINPSSLQYSWKLSWNGARTTLETVANEQFLWVFDGVEVIKVSYLENAYFLSF